MKTCGLYVKSLAAKNMNYEKGMSANFVHFYDGRWWIYQKFPNGIYLTPEREKRIYSKDFKSDSYFARQPLFDIAYSYTRRAHALVKAKELCEAGMFSIN